MQFYSIYILHFLQRTATLSYQHVLTQASESESALTKVSHYYDCMHMVCYGGLYTVLHYSFCTSVIGHCI